MSQTPSFFSLPTQISTTYFPFVLLLGLTHEVIDVSSNSDRSETESDRQLIRTLLEDRRNRGRAAESVSTSPRLPLRRMILMPREIMSMPQTTF